MSQHQSLKVDSVGARHRNVLTRIERIKKLTEQKRWDVSKSAFNLPKVKSMKIKVKKSAKKGPEAGAEGAAAVPVAAAPAAAKKAAPAAPKK